MTPSAKSFPASTLIRANRRAVAIWRFGAQRIEFQKERSAPSMRPPIAASIPSAATDGAGVQPLLKRFDGQGGKSHAVHR